MKLILFKILCVWAFHANCQIVICGKEISYHPIDKQLFKVKDSLKNKGIDTILLYRHWEHKNGFDGYGKVVWLDNGQQFQCKWIFENIKDGYRLKLLGKKWIKEDTLIRYYFENHLWEVKSNPDKSPISISHDHQHFVQLIYENIKYCFILDGVEVLYGTDDLRANWIKLLAERDVCAVKEYVKRRF